MTDQRKEKNDSLAIAGMHKFSNVSISTIGVSLERINV